MFGFDLEELKEDFSFYINDLEEDLVVQPNIHEVKKRRMI